MNSRKDIPFMKKRKIVFFTLMLFIILIIVLFLFFQHHHRKNEIILSLSPQQKLADFEALCAILDENYPFWHEAEKAGIMKNILYDTYRSNIQNTKTDIQFFKELNYFQKEFDGLGHLSLLDGSMYRLYLKALATSEEMLTSRETRQLEPLKTVLTNPTSENTYSLLDQSHAGFRSTIGLKEEYQNASATTATEATSNLTTSIWADQNTAYLTIQSFALSNYEQDKTVLADFFAEVQEIPNLIIDLRGNGGGSDLYWEDLLVAPNAKEHLISERYYVFHSNETTAEYAAANNLIAESIAASQEPQLSQYADFFSHYIKDTTTFDVAANPYPGNIYVLVDDEVYSASENFVIFCKNTGFATLVGTTTGGDGGIADPMLFALPNSGLIVRFSVFYGLNADGSGNEAKGTVPDIVTTAEEDALEKCLAVLN